MSACLVCTITHTSHKSNTLCLKNAGILDDRVCFVPKNRKQIIKKNPQKTCYEKNILSESS